jgi:hypothetical protein
MSEGGKVGQAARWKVGQARPLEGLPAAAREVLVDFARPAATIIRSLCLPVHALHVTLFPTTLTWPTFHRSILQTLHRPQLEAFSALSTSWWSTRNQQLVHVGLEYRRSAVGHSTRHNGAQNNLGDAFMRVR